MKTVFYGRYSSHNQTEQSIEGQLHVCERYAAENGLTITAHYIDRAISGTTDKRPEFQRMLSDSSRGLFEAVIVYKLDRFARDRYHSAIAKHKLKENGVRLISATEHLTDTPEGIIMEALLEGMDEYYSKELSQKCRRGLVESFNKGRFIGALPPFGYKVVDHILTIDETAAPIALEIFTRYAEGEKQAHIIADLNQRGIPNASGNKWNTCNISKMLQNTIYKGVYTVSTMNGEIICPAIVTPELFDRVQNVKKEAVHAARARRSDFRYILTGLTVCGACGGRLCGHSVDNGKHNYYRCSKCYKQYGRADALHETVRAALSEHLTADKLDELAAAAFHQYELETAPTDERKLLERELETVKKKLSNAVDAILNGAYNSTLQKTMDELETRQAEILERLETLSTPIPRLTYDNFRAALALIVTEAETTHFEKLLHAVVHRIIAYESHLIICINLTDETSEPPLEQILCSVKDTSQPLTLYKNGWLMIAA